MPRWMGTSEQKNDRMIMRFNWKKEEKKNELFEEQIVADILIRHFVGKSFVKL